MTLPHTPRESGSLQGKVALVTGGAQGIGRAIAATFQQAGACVFLVDCDQAAGARAAAELNAADPSVAARFLPADLEKPGDIVLLAEVFGRESKRLDVLVNNAAVELDKPFIDISAEDWDRLQAVNLRAPFLVTQALLPCFPEQGGAVINISSIHSSHAFPNSLAYACSKAGLVALTRNLALELGPRGIRVNALCPGYIDTRLWEEYLKGNPDAASFAEQVAALHPVGRRGTPTDVANAALFLAAAGSAFITGTDLVIDGGLTVRAHT